MFLDLQNLPQIEPSVSDDEAMARQFLEFCRGKPRDEEYDYSDIFGCAVCQFLIAYGYAERPTTGNVGWLDLANFGNGQRRPQPISDDMLLVRSPRTFGALTDRIEASLSKQEG